MPKFRYFQSDSITCGAAALMVAAAELGYGELTRLGNTEADMLLAQLPIKPNLTAMLTRLQVVIDRSFLYYPEPHIRWEKPASPPYYDPAGSNTVAFCESIEKIIFMATNKRNGVSNPDGSWPSSIARTARIMGLRVEMVYISHDARNFTREKPDFQIELDIFMQEFPYKFTYPPFPLPGTIEPRDFGPPRFPAGMGAHRVDSRQIMLFLIPNIAQGIYNFHWAVRRTDGTIMNTGHSNLDYNPTLLAIEVSRRLD